MIFFVDEITILVIPLAVPVVRFGDLRVPCAPPKRFSGHRTKEDLP
jgi:hypothetical protein